MTGGLDARRKALTKSMEYPVSSEGWITKEIWGLDRMLPELIAGKSRINAL